MARASAASLPLRESTSKWVEGLARVGYAAIGVVYALVGVLTLSAAWGVGPSAINTREAIRRIGQQPFGSVWLAAVGIGLVAFVLWRFVQAIQYPGLPSGDLKSTFKRLGFAISGVVYGLLAFTAVNLAIGMADQHDKQSAAESWTRWTFTFPLGEWLIGMIGGSIIGVGIGQFYLAATASFLNQYDLSGMSTGRRKAIKFIGRFGLAARGVTFSIIGVFLIQAAIYADAGVVKGLGEAFLAVAAQPFGPWLLAAVAVGFVAFGIYCFSQARYCYFKTA